MPIDNVTLIFVELAFGLVLAVIIGAVVRFLHQPLILAYLITGILISLLGVFRLGEKEVLPLLANFGVVLLLFLVGLELRVSDIKHLGKSAILVGLGQLVFTFALSLLIVRSLGFPLVETFYIATAVTFSSTIIVIKLLTEKKDLNSLYGKITIGILLVQDAAAILALIFLTGFEPASGQIINPISFLPILVKAVVVILTAVILARLILPQTFSYSATSPELLLITALAWCFFYAAFSKLIGFSLEIGAFIAGVTLATSPYQLAILSKVRPMRDFFIVVFFIFLGTNMIISQLPQFLLPAAILSLFVLIGKPLIILPIAGFLGHKKRTSFLTAVAIAQVSEFSLILALTGFKLGHIGQEVVSLIATVAMITIAVTSYLINNSNWLYSKFSQYLNVFERSQAQQNQTTTKELTNHIILVGCEQVGRDILAYLVSKMGKSPNIIVVDFNPTIIQGLIADGVNAIYGDIADFELLASLNLRNAKVIISTVPDVKDNLFLIKAASNAQFSGPLILTAYWAKDGLRLYEAGADFVLVPELAGGDAVIAVLSKHWENLPAIKTSKLENLTQLAEKTKT